MGCSEFFSISWECEADRITRYHCDVSVTAPTGQGKTLVYAVPVLHHILQWPADSCQALVIVPTRDLADQVSSTFATLAGNVRIATVAGQRAFERPEDLVADVIVATPGRLVDVLPLVDWSELRWLIADEADRLLAQPSQPHVCRPN